jgi:hypothetical protein
LALAWGRRAIFNGISAQEILEIRFNDRRVYWLIPATAAVVILMIPAGAKKKEQPNQN